MHAGRGPDDRSRMFGTGTTQGFRGTFQGPHCLLFMGEAIRSTPLRKFRGRREERCLKSSRSSLIPPNTGNAPCRPGRRFREGVRPELAAKVEDMGKYDVIFIGSPNWWSTIAPPVASFLASYDLSGKTVIPFVTHGGGGMARCADEVRKLCPKSTVLKGGAFAGEGIRTTRAALVKWVNETISINK